MNDKKFKAGDEVKLLKSTTFKGFILSPGLEGRVLDSYYSGGFNFCCFYTEVELVKDTVYLKVLLDVPTYELDFINELSSEVVV